MAGHFSAIDQELAIHDEQQAAVARPLSVGRTSVTGKCCIGWNRFDRETSSYSFGWDDDVHPSDLERRFTCGGADVRFLIGTERIVRSPSVHCGQKSLVRSIMENKKLASVISMAPTASDCP